MPYLSAMLAVLAMVMFLVTVYVLLMLYYGWGWILTPSFEPKDGYVATTKVSIIVPARNEEANIQSLLQCLQKQNYPKHLYEIIVVNDHSHENTAALAEALGAKVLNLPANQLGKKAAITLGVAHATGNFILTTDADCTMGRQWLPTVVRYYQCHGCKITTGPVVFAKPQLPYPKLLYHFQSLDLMGLMFITAGSLRFKFPHMANGANFGFEKKLFQSLNGYKGIDTNPSGDDILFLLKAHSHYPGCAGFVKSKDAVVSTRPTLTWPAFWQQRKRWVSKADGFGDWRLTVILVFYYVYALAIMAALATALINPTYILPLLFLLFGKLLPELVMLANATRFFGRTKELAWFLPAQLMHLGYVLYIGAAAQSKKYVWKGRNHHT